MHHLLLLSAALVLTPAAPAQGPGRGTMPSADHPSAFRDLLSRGKDAIARVEWPPQFQMPFDRLVERLGATEGRYRSRFQEYVQRRALGEPTAGLTGKAVLVTLKGQRRNLPLLQVRVSRLGNEAFLVGVAAEDGPSGYAKGQTVWVALGEVATLTEYAGADDLRKFLERGREAGRPAP